MGEEVGEVVGLTREQRGKWYRKKTIRKYVEGLRAAGSELLFVPLFPPVSSLLRCVSDGFAGTCPSRCST